MWESGKSSARGAERSLFSPLMLPAGRQAQPNNRSQSFGSPEYQTKKSCCFKLAEHMASHDSCWWQRLTSNMNYDLRIILMTSGGLLEGALCHVLSTEGASESELSLSCFKHEGRSCCVCLFFSWRSLKISAEAAANREVVAICQMLVTYQLTCVLLAVCDRALQLQECECSASDWNTRWSFLEQRGHICTCHGLLLRTLLFYLMIEDKTCHFFIVLFLIWHLIDVAQNICEIQRNLSTSG